jgi:hypothetical protein
MTSLEHARNFGLAVGYSVAPSPSNGERRRGMREAGPESELCQISSDLRPTPLIPSLRWGERESRAERPNYSHTLTEGAVR